MNLLTICSAVQNVSFFVNFISFHFIFVGGEKRHILKKAKTEKKNGSSTKFIERKQIHTSQIFFRLNNNIWPLEPNLMGTNACFFLLDIFFFIFNTVSKMLLIFFLLNCYRHEYRIPKYSVEIKEELILFF